MRRRGIALLVLAVLPWCAWAEDRAGPAGHGIPASPPEQGFAVARWSVDAGGGSSTGGAYAVAATAGQPDTGVSSKCGAVVSAGLWSGPVDFQPIHCDGFDTGDTSMWSSATGSAS